MASKKELSVNEKVDLIYSIGEEVIEEKDQIKWLIENRKPYDILAYDGFEPSGNIHIAQGLIRTINVNKLIKSGVKFIFLVADWHAAANNKFGGDLDIIKKVGRFFIEVWRACGMDLKHVEFKWASDLVKDPDYWKLVLNVSMNSTLKRVQRCTQIMGRGENEALQSSQILYPLMQCADVFYLGVDICQLGLDQRKVNMLAREVAGSLGKRHKPIAIHHPMLMGLGKPPEDDLDEIDKKVARKMSKSNPNSAIFMLDTKKDVQRKINKAWCPQFEINDNPVLDYCKYIIFEMVGKMEINRPEKFGGNVSYDTYMMLEAAYENGSLSPVDLKQSVVKYLNELLDPIRKRFEENEEAKELLKFVKGLSNKSKTK